MIHALLLSIFLFPSQTAAPLTAQPPIVVPGGPAKYDFMSVDSKNRMVFAAHPGSSSFTVVNLDSGEVKNISAGLAVNGIWSDSSSKRLFAAGPGKTLVEFNMDDWSKVGSLPLDGPGDSVLVDPQRKVVYVDNDDGTNLWVVDPTTLKIVSTITIKEAPEVMVLDGNAGKIYQNIKSTNSIQVIDADSKKVAGEYTLGDLKSPHGLAIDTKLQELFSVGKNGKLVILNAGTGAILQTLDVVQNSDQISYDRKLKRLYIPGSGELDVVQVDASGAKLLGSVPAPKGCHSVVVDPQTHDVWVAYTDATNSYVMKFTATASTSTAR